MRNLLTAGSSLRVVARDKNDTARYYVHADLYTTLARIRARELAMDSARTPAHRGRPAPASGHRRRPSTTACQPSPRRPALGPGDDELRASFQDPC